MTRCPRCAAPADIRAGRLTCGICELDIPAPPQPDNNTQP